MKNLLLSIICFVAFAAGSVGCSTSGAGNSAALVSAGQKAVQAMMISDEYVRQYVKQFIDELDDQSTIASASSPYTIRLARITAPFVSSGLNFKVYITGDVNAFAVADGSIRVYSGLMDIMDDHELLGIIGHEIGHVMNHDSRDAFRRALLTSALRDGITAVGGTVGALSASELGAIGENLSQSQYSQKQELEADEYGYRFLKDHGVNPWAMAMALEKLQRIEQSAGVRTGGMQQLFSSHPQIEKRLERLSRQAHKDGFQRPATSAPSPASAKWVF